MRRPTLRTQLTLLYAVPFLLTGAALVSLPILQTSNTSPVGSAPVPDAAANEQTSPLLGATVIALAGLVIIAFVLGWIIAGRFLRPLREITSTARDISATNLHRRLGLSGRKDEFAELAGTLDDLFGRLESSFESQRHFVANASHELRTPLTAERALLQVALADPGATVETLRATCHDLLELGERQERLIRSLLTLANSEQGIERREPVDLARVAESVVAARQAEADRRGITIETALGAASATGDPSLIESLVANLVDNALRHNVSDGRVEVVTGGSSISVRNTGPVIPPERIERLFQPFQRLDGQRLGTREGHGLGLAIVRAIARAHGATLTPRSRPEGGLDIAVAF